ncbi:hypothetical protein DFH06DRAFT_1326871 [Mycena polygramma]|nr:hypothetical protein DFH06DRAFT_1326871 [Mycena polygramma]
MIESINLRLMKELRFLGVGSTDVEKAVAHCKDLQAENWFPPIEEPLLRSKLGALIDILTRQLRLGGEDSTATAHQTLRSDSMEARMIETVIDLGIVSVDIDQAAHLLLKLRDQDWFPQIGEPVLYQRLKAISDLFGEGLGCSVA